MAIRDKTTGKYFKVVRDLTEFRPSSVTVWYYEFDSKEDRDEFFRRRALVFNILTAGDMEYNRLNSELRGLWEALKAAESEGADLEVFKSPIEEKIKEADSLMKDLSSLRFGWDSGNFKKDSISKDSKLYSLGLDDILFTPLKNWSLNSVMTGAFTNQTFSYDCLYKELKKVFGTGCIDC